MRSLEERKAERRERRAEAGLEPLDADSGAVREADAAAAKAARRGGKASDKGNDGTNPFGS